MYIENEKLGLAATDLLGKELPLEMISTLGADKVARAAPQLVKLERGEIRLPKEPLPWLAELYAYGLRWTGHPWDVGDQVDAAAYAAIVGDDHAANAFRLAF
jgi:hypothetical protein